MDPTNLNPNPIAEAERNLTIATKLLAARDLIGSKRFAELAIDSFPKLSDDRPDQILAISDVLLASQKRVNNHYDWYSILQLPHPTSSSSSSSASSSELLKRNYRRLNLLLHPDRNRSPGADSAFRLIADAYSVLSDPTKKALFDAELNISDHLSSSTTSNEPSFWTMCTSCCHVHQYHRAHLNKTLRCQTCRKAFNAVELQSSPPIVPGTDMYYASWGFFPLGFGNGNGSDYKPFVPMNNPFGGGSDQTRSGAPPDHHQQPQPPHGSGGGPMGSTGRNKKKPARKKVMSGLKNRTFNFGNMNQGNVMDHDEEAKEDDVVEEEEEVRGININEAAKGPEDGGVVSPDIDMMIDLETDEMLGNLHNLPFLKDEGINMQMPYGRAGGV